MKTQKVWRRTLAPLGPAFVAAVAYVDPGNFAANFSAGAAYGYLLLWVLVAANIMAALAQYLSAKVGIVTGQSLPEIIAAKLPRWGRVMYWLQAEIVAVATDIAEVVGGAIALYLLWRIPLPIGGCAIGVISMALLWVYSHHGQKYFERLIVVLLLIIPLGFIGGLWQHPPDVDKALSGLVPQFGGKETVLLAAAMVGATVMPHVIYLHSALTRDRHGRVAAHDVSEYLRSTKIDVLLAMAIAGLVNIAMLVLAASSLEGTSVGTFGEIFTTLSEKLGIIVGVLFAVGLLISGLASTSVGSQAGSVIMQDFVRVPLPLWARRLITMLPALLLLLLGVDPVLMLIISQVALSFGVPFALIPLALVVQNRAIMKERASGAMLRGILWSMVGLITALNLFLVVLLVLPHILG